MQHLCAQAIEVTTQLDPTLHQITTATHLPVRWIQTHPILVEDRQMAEEDAEEDNIYYF